MTDDIQAKLRAQAIERVRAMREWLEIAKPVPQMTEKRCEQLVEALRDAESALIGQSTERARQQGLKTALVDLVEDLEARWDMNDSHTNPGIRHCVEQARKALRCADELESGQ